MRYRFISERCKILGLLLLLAAGSAVLRAQDQPGIKNIRTVVYEPLLKDTTWVTGKVVDYITFVKYDSKGRTMVENRLKPDGSPHGKLVYVYNSAGQVSREIYATADRGVSDCWNYTYDEKGRLNSIVSMNGQEDTLQIVSALYDEAGKVLKKYSKDYVKNRSWGRQVLYNAEGMPEKVILIDGPDGNMERVGEYRVESWDTLTLKRKGVLRLGKMRVVKDNNQKNPIRKIDEAGNWTERFEGCNESGEPNFIIRRDIEYGGGGNDREKIPVRGKVKKVQQRSYIAIAKGPQAVDKGEKKGQFFVYEFGENGRKIKEERFTEAGVCREKIQYEYDETGNLLKESHYTPAGVLTVNKNYGYDKEGRLKHCSILDDKGEIIQRDIFRYDIEGNMVQEAGYLTNGTKCSEFRYIYDSYGQQIERKVLLQPEGSDPVGSVRRGYNFQGRVVFEEYFSPDGTPQSQHTYRYNTKGELISGTECPEGQTEEVKYVYKFHNDDQGNWKIRIKYIDDVPVVYEEREYTYYN